MWRHALIALLLGYGAAGTAWLFLYGPARSNALTPLAAGFGFAAALFIASGFWILASVGSGLAIARDETSRTLPGFCVFAASTLSIFTVVVSACYYLR